MGNYLETSPELVKRMAEEGHIVGNHTYHHPDMSKISDKQSFEKELKDLENLYTQVTGQTMKKYYRPPQGKYSENNLKWPRRWDTKPFSGALPMWTGIRINSPQKEEAFKSY